MTPPVLKGISWSPEQQQSIYLDWANYYADKNLLDKALQYYDKSLELKSNDHKTMCYRAKCRRDAARIAEALEDSVQAASIVKKNAPINLGVCKALYELNDFENSAVRCYENTVEFTGNKVKQFFDLIDVINGNFNDSVGDSLGPFISKNEKNLPAIIADYEKRTNIDNRPLWKIMKELGKCDVLSILEKEPHLLSPREMARRYLAFRVFFQTYFGKSWIDVVFLKHLRQNSELLLPQMKESTPFLKNLTQTNYDTIRKFIQMLEARSPLYNEKLRKCKDKKAWDEQCEKHLNRIQYQTRRNTLSILKNIRLLRKAAKIQELRKYVEKVMGDYIVLKTQRLLPWKFKFVTEVYNTLALAYADLCVAPENLFLVKTNERLLVLFGLPTESVKDKVQFKFGDKSTYVEADVPDYAYIAYKKYVGRLETRLLFARYPIERSYLQHEIAYSHLRQGHFPECRLSARKGVEEAILCQNGLWELLNVLQICKAFACVYKVEHCTEWLENAYSIAEKLNSVELCQFFLTSLSINTDQILLKKSRRSMDSIVKKRSKLSLASRASILSQASADRSNKYE